MQYAMNARTRASDLGSAAEAAVRDLLRERGFRVTTAADGADLVVTPPAGDAVRIEVKAAALPTLDWVAKLPKRVAAGAAVVVVGDQISGDVRAALDKRGIGWLDRRGHFRLVVPGMYVDVDVPPTPRAGVSVMKHVIRGRAGLAAAAQLLMAVDAPVNASEIARAAGLNTSSITRALQTLVDEQLVERRSPSSYRPLTPELFWAVAEVWPRAGELLQVDLARLRDLQRPDFSGPALAGVRGAVAWGAPLAITADTPARVYVPDDATLRAARALESKSGDPVEIAVDPIGLITRHRYPRAEVIPRAHQVFCALDLTGTARDREALEQMGAAEGFTRVW
jgi:hypothetical protein